MAGQPDRARGEACGAVVGRGGGARELAFFRAKKNQCRPADGPRLSLTLPYSSRGDAAQPPAMRPIPAPAATPEGSITCPRTRLRPILTARNGAPTARPPLPESRPPPPTAGHRLNLLPVSTALLLLPASPATAASLDTLLYSAAAAADAAVRAALAPSTAGALPSPAAFAIVAAAGLATSLSPCTLSMLPLTIGYIAGAEARDRRQTAAAGGAREEEASAASASPPSPPPPSTLPRAAAFAAGFASTLAAGGVAAAAAGRVYVGAGSLVAGGDGNPAGTALAAALPLAGSATAVLMGLSLLGAVRLPALPGLDVDGDALAARLAGSGGAGAPRRTLPAPLRAYVAGAAFALAASPCATPVLATLLAYAASGGGSPGAGGALLAVYAVGYTSPLLAAAAGAGALTRVVALRERSGWVPPAAGAALVAGGVYGLLSRLVPP